MSAQLREETDKHTAQAERSRDATDARRGPRAGQAWADLPPRVKGAKQGGVDFLDGGDGQAGCPEARTTVTCGSVMLLQVTSSLLYTMKGIYSPMSLKSQGPGRVAAMIK